SFRQSDRAVVQLEGQDEVATRAPRAAEASDGAPAVVESSPAHQRGGTQRTTARGLVRKLTACPPVTTRSHHHAREDVEGLGGSVEETLHVGLETVSGIHVTAERPPLELSGLPVRRPAE